MKSSFSLTDGYRQLLFGQWMPHILLEEYETGQLHIVDRMWDIPTSPESYLKVDKKLLNRWLTLADLQEDFSHWLPPFYQMNDSLFEPFHPVCRFYTTVLWCENRMIIQVLHQWQEEQELTILKYELVTLQNQLIDYLQECKKRNSDSISNTDNTISKLGHYLNSFAKGSILILFLEINERFGHILAERNVGIEELFVRHLKTQVPSELSWFSSVDRIKWHLKGIQENSETEEKIIELLTQIKEEQNQQEPLYQKTLLGSRHILENTWFCWKILSEQKGNGIPFSLAETEKAGELLLEWKLMLLCQPIPGKKSKEVHQEIFHIILNCLAESLSILETERQPLSEAASLALLIKDLFSEETTHSGASQIPGKKSPSNIKGHWLLDQYIPLYQVQEKLGVTPRTMRTYISEYNLQVSEITAKSKWVKAEDFETFMEQFKKKGTAS